MPIYTLPILCIILLIAEILLARLEIISPSVLFTASFLFCSICAWYMSDDWTDLEYVQVEMGYLIIISILIFFVIELLFKKVTKAGSERNKCKVDVETLSISRGVLLFTIFLGFICIIWNAYYIAKYISEGNWIAMMAMYRDTVNLYVTDFDVSKKILNQFMKLMTGLSYVALFVYVSSKNILPVKTKMLYYIVFVVYMVFRALLSGGRQGILFFLLAWFSMYYICNIIDGQSRLVRTKLRKFYAYFMLYIITIFISFYSLGRFLGRGESENIFYAPLGYLTSGLFGLADEIKKHYVSQFWGQYSFPGLNDLLKLCSIIPDGVEEQSFLPFFLHGNTVTMLGRWYWDFGIFGVYTMVALSACIFCYIYYCKIKYNKMGHLRNIFIIIYCYMAHILYFAGYDDFWINVYSVTFILNVFMIVFVYKFVVMKKLTVVFMSTEKKYENKTDL